MVATTEGFLGEFFTFVVHAEVQSVIGFPVEEIQLPVNYFKLGCCLLSFKIIKQITLLWSTYLQVFK